MMTPDALAALARAGFSRRDFLKTSGALVVTFSAAASAERVGLAQGQLTPERRTSTRNSSTRGLQSPPTAG
jgi:hypothetical protein